MPVSAVFRDRLHPDLPAKRRRLANLSTLSSQAPGKLCSAPNGISRAKVFSRHSPARPPREPTRSAADAQHVAGPAPSRCSRIHAEQTGAWTRLMSDERVRTGLRMRALSTELFRDAGLYPSPRTNRTELEPRPSVARHPQRVSSSRLQIEFNANPTPEPGRPASCASFSSIFPSAPATFQHFYYLHTSTFAPPDPPPGTHPTRRPARPASGRGRLRIRTRFLNGAILPPLA